MTLVPLPLLHGRGNNTVIVVVIVLVCDNAALIVRLGSKHNIVNVEPIVGFQTLEWRRSVPNVMLSKEDALFPGVHG